MLPLTLAVERHPELVEPHLGTIVAGDRDVFTAANDADWTGGAFVYVPRGVSVDAPILLTAIARRRRHRAATAASLIVLEEGAEAEVWEQYLSGAEDGETLLNTVVELVVGQNATPALRLRPGPQREVVDLRHPARRGGARRPRSTGSRSASAPRSGRVRMETLLAGEGAHAQGHRRLRAARAASTSTSTPRRSTARPTPRPDLAFRGILSDRSTRGLARDDQGRPGRPADRRVPGVPQPAALQARARRRDPGPGDPRQRRPLHARGGDRPDRQGAALLPALARAGRGARPSGS